MTPLSPMDAQRRLSYARKHGIHMSAEHRRAMETIAAMREEWGVEVTHYRDGDLHTRWGYDDRKDAEAFARYMGKDPRWNTARVVHRYVTTPEEA